MGEKGEGDGGLSKEGRLDLQAAALEVEGRRGEAAEVERGRARSAHGENQTAQRGH